MLRLILFFILFFIIYKVAKFAIRMYSSVNIAKKQFEKFSEGQKPMQPQEVEYTEIETELHNHNNK